MSGTLLQSRLLKWYRKNKRILPWRDHPDPYAVWVSEIMLQQTRVETVIPYFENWMRKFPTVKMLAGSTERKVLHAWEGLGYYSRARNLHKASKLIVLNHGGKLPPDTNGLLNLPGIGRYTAGAIASIAFGKDEAVLDGNLKRVYARLFDISDPVDSSKGEKKLWEIAESSLPKGSAGDFNQAMMDLGATICVPKNPFCSVCPVIVFCESYKNGTQGSRPVRKAKKDVPHYILAAGVIVMKGKVLLAQRRSGGLLGGMWEFPNGRVDRDPVGGLTKVLRSGYRLKIQRREALGIFKHAYSHFKITVHAFECGLSSKSKNEGLRWVALKDLEEYPMGKVDRQIAKKVAEILESRQI